MAEVQRRLEAFTVELEELTQLGFFSEEECTSLVKKQFEYENKINSMNKSVDDFKEYITYIIALYRIIKIRRNKIKIGDKKNHLEYRVLQRVKNLYEMAVMRFPQEVNLYFDFFQFCKEAAFQHATNKMLTMMIKHHKNNEEVWLTAARLYFHEKNDSLKAIKLLQQAISILNTSALYTECIQYEVYSVAINQKKHKKSNIDEEQNEEVTKLLKKIGIYLKQAKRHVTHTEFYTDLLTFLKQFNFTSTLQADLIEYLCDNHGNCANMWHYLAQSELNGSHYDREQKIVIFSMKSSFLNCISTYEQGLEVISSENRVKLWDYYIQSVIDFKSNEHFDKVTNYPRLALTAFERAAGENCLADKYYLHYLDLVPDEKKCQILNQANEQCPNSLDLWTLRLRIDIAQNDNEIIVKTFQNACANVDKDALSLWELMHDYLSKESSVTVLKEFYLTAIKQNGVISDHFKVMYIKYLASLGNLDDCRDVFQRFVSVKQDFTNQLYETMLNIELSQVKKCNSEVRLEAVHKQACKLIGDENVDVWINYIGFLWEFKSITLAKDSITKVTLEARRRLSSELLSDFEERYDKVAKQMMSKNLKRKRGCT